MIYGVMVTYNDWPMIQRSIGSIYNKVDKIIVVDGRYSDFPIISNSDFSTDGTISYLSKLEKVDLILQEGLIEPDKRNLYLVGEAGDWYVHLDSDEEWVGDIDLPKADMLVSWLKRERQKQFMKRVRLFRHVEGLHYEGKHYWLKDGGGNTFALLDKPGEKYKAAETDKVKIIHHENERDAERLSAKKQYYKKLYKREGRIRET